jgi:integrase
MGKRAYGSGSLFEYRGAWYGQWRVAGRQVKRKLGGKRSPGGRDGLTRKQAEARLRRAMNELRVAPPEERLNFAEVGERYLRHLAPLGRKRSTVQDYESTFRIHLRPFFGDAAMERIGRGEIEAFVAFERRQGRAPKSVLNYLGLLHSIFAYAEKRGWTNGNPCKLVDKPRADQGDVDIRFLTQPEIDALVGAVPDDSLGAVERTLYLTAAMTGMRQGELLALRWLDIDWMAGRVRVRRNYVRNEFGTPKSKRSSRSVPLADRLAGELERHFQRSQFQADDELVFAHPLTGKPLDRSKLLKRFKKALRCAGVREVRFHDMRHTFGTRMAAAGVPMRTLQEWMGHRDFKTTLIYADYAPDAHEAELVERAFRASPSYAALDG